MCQSSYSDIRVVLLGILVGPSCTLHHFADAISCTLTLATKRFVTPQSSEVHNQLSAQLKLGHIPHRAQLRALR